MSRQTVASVQGPHGSQRVVISPPIHLQKWRSFQWNPPAKCNGRGNPGTQVAVVVKTVLASHFGVGAPLILVYFSGDWDVDWGHGSCQSIAIATSPSGKVGFVYGIHPQPTTPTRKRVQSPSVLTPAENNPSYFQGGVLLQKRTESPLNPRHTPSHKLLLINLGFALRRVDNSPGKPFWFKREAKRSNMPSNRNHCQGSSHETLARGCRLQPLGRQTERRCCPPPPPHSACNHGGFRI